MADKYIRHGETFNGDGTTSAAATSNGGVGAWNSITLLEGATTLSLVGSGGAGTGAGSINAGDRIYIRGKDAAGADVTRTVSVAMNLGSTAGTQAAPVQWVLDDGTIWSGVTGGVLTFRNDRHITITARNFNQFVAYNRGGIVFSIDPASIVWSSVYMHITGLGGRYRNCTFDVRGNTALSMGFGVSLVGNTPLLFEYCDFKRAFTTGRLFNTGLGTDVTFVDPEFELTEATENDMVFGGGGRLSRIRMFGGRAYGAGVVSSVPFFDVAGDSTVEVYGTDLPKVMKFYNAVPLGYSNAGAGNYTAVGLDGGFGGLTVNSWGEVSSRQDFAFPKLNAVLPDSATTGWSWRAHPSAADLLNHLNFTLLKTYTAAAAVATLRVNFLVEETFSGLNTENLWLNVTYIDSATSGHKTFTTRAKLGAGAALTSDPDSPWTPLSGSQVTYGPLFCDRYKISTTTPTAVKQDTPIFVTFCVGKAAGNVEQVIFVCPDVVLS